MSTLFSPLKAHSATMKLLIRRFATASSIQASTAPAAKPRRKSRSLFSSKNAPTQVSAEASVPLESPKPRYHPEILEEPLSRPRIDKSIIPCGSKQADSFFANVAGHNLTTEDMWSPRKYTKWIMPPDETGRQDPGTYWPDFVTEPSQLKGIHQHTVGNGIKKSHYSHRIIDFTSTYLSPWTTQGVFRKTRPSIVIQWHSFLPLNGHTIEETGDKGYAPPGKPTSTGMSKKDLKSPCPLSSSVYRSMTAKLYRRLFLEEFHKIPGACDGVYIFRVRKVPENEGYVRSGMAEMIRHVADDWKHQKNLFKPESMEMINRALEAYGVVEPLTPVLTKVRRFDPALKKSDENDQSALNQK